MCRTRTQSKKHYSGQSMVEVVVTIGIVILLVTGLVAATTSTIRVGQMSKDRTQAVQYAKEGQEIVRILKDVSWSNIPQTGTYCLGKGYREPVPETCPMNIDNTFSRTVSFSSDVTCPIPDCRIVTVTVSWMEGQEPRSVTLTSYLTDWRAR